MADNQLVSNSYLSTNPDIRPRAIEKSSGGANCLTQVMALDIGGSGAENLVTAINPLPVSATIDTTGLATDTKQDAQTAILTTIDADTGAIAASVAAIDADATTIIGHVDGIEALLTTIDTSLNNIEAVAGTTTITKTALTPSAPTAASVGVASASALAANGSRKGLVLTNTSTATISLGLGAAAVLNSGITLTPNGVWVMDEYTFCTSQIFAIASAAASNLAIQEFA